MLAYSLNPKIYSSSNLNSPAFIFFPSSENYRTVWLPTYSSTHCILAFPATSNKMVGFWSLLPKPPDLSWSLQKTLLSVSSLSLISTHCWLLQMWYHSANFPTLSLAFLFSTSTGSSSSTYLLNSLFLRVCPLFSFYILYRISFSLMSSTTR